MKVSVTSAMQNVIVSHFNITVLMNKGFARKIF